MQVPLLDLKLQYQALKIDLDNAILKVAETQNFILGPEVESLEKSMCNYLKTGFSVGVSSGTDALLLALMAIDLKPQDEVIVPTYSFFATAGVVARLNAVPIFVDVDPITFNINPDEIRKKITSKTKAIIPVHLYGQSADMDPIMEIASKYKLYVIEDGAQAIGAQYKNGKNVGTIGHIGCFSFFPSKNLGCYGDGGLVITNDPIIADKLKILRVHGSSPKYYHKLIGGNFRIDAIQAAVLNIKLKYLDEWSELRRRNAVLYSRLFLEAGLADDDGKVIFNKNNKILIPKPVYKSSYYEENSFKKEIKNYHIYNQYVIRVQERDKLKQYLAMKSIGTEIYYPVPFHNQECFSFLNSKLEEFPNANMAAKTSLAIPIFPELKEEQIYYVVSMIKEFLS